MKPVVFLIFLIGVGAMIQRTVDFSSEESSFSAIAVNYAIYRNEVFRYVYENNGLSGDIPLAVLDLPESWRALRNWRARVDATFTVMRRCKKSRLCVSSSGEVLLWEWPAMAALSL